MSQVVILPDLNNKVLEMPIEAASDHDLLIRIDAKLGMMTESLNAFQTASQTDRSKLWADKASMREMNVLSTRIDRAAPSDMAADHERRLRILEHYVWIAIGAGYVLMVVLRFGWPH